MKDKQTPAYLPLLFSNRDAVAVSRDSVLLAYTQRPAPEDFFHTGLTVQEQGYAKRLNQKGRRQFLQSRWLLKQLVGSQVATPQQQYSSLFEQDAGRITLTGEHRLAKWRVSLSHSQNASAVLVSSMAEMPLGVDIEWLKRSRPWAQMADICLGPAESEYFAHGQTADDFYRYWTQKEALAKASGRALSALFKLDSAEVAYDHGLSLYSCYCDQHALSCALPHGLYLQAFRV